MAWIDETYLNEAIGSAQVTALGLTSGSARLTQYELAARATVLSVLAFAGYSGFSSTLLEVTDAEKITAAFLKKIAASLMLRDAYALIPGISLSRETQAAISQGLTMLDSVFEKKLPVPGVEPAALDGYGGVAFNVEVPSKHILTKMIFRTLRGTGF